MVGDITILLIGYQKSVLKRDRFCSILIVSRHSSICNQRETKLQPLPQVTEYILGL